MQEDFLFKQVERYLQRRMAPEEKELFEKEIENSQSLRDFIAIYDQIDILNEEKEWTLFEGNINEIKNKISLFETTETQEFSNKLSEIQQAYSEKTKPKSINWMRTALVTGIAACLAIVLYLVFPKENIMDQLYVENSRWKELPSLTVKGENRNQDAEIEQLFQQKKFKEVIARLEDSKLISETIDPTLQLYLGISYLEIDAFPQALKIFKDLTQSETIDYHKGYWYTAMVYLKQKNEVEFLKVLQTIAANPNYYKNKEAVSLVAKLK